jgi:hypothetical protein
VGKYLDILARAEARDKSDISDKRAAIERSVVPQTPFGRFCRFGRTLSALEGRCPDLVPVERWQRAVEDSRTFLAKWGEQAEALGWTARDLFGLHTPSETPRPNYSRLSRYDATGLVWLLEGREVVALTEATAAIQNPTGAVTIYRRFNKPALGPVGDSLDDLRGRCDDRP